MVSGVRRGFPSRGIFQRCRSFLTFAAILLGDEYRARAGAIGWESRTVKRKIYYSGTKLIC
jgi:hypothetical protein